MGVEVKEDDVRGESPAIRDRRPLAKAGAWCSALRIPPVISWLSLAVFPLLVAIALLGLTSERSYSLGLFPDSLTYIESARWFAVGQGLSLGEAGSLKPMTHFPPLYPVALAAGTMIGEAPERTAGLLHPVCLGLTLFFLGCLVFRLGGSVAVAVTAQGFAAVSWDVLSAHLVLLSEPLFLALSFGAIYLLTEHQRKDSPPYLICAAVLLGLASLTRFAGLGIAFGAGVYFAWSSRHRIRDTAIVLLGGVAPILVWFAAHRGAERHGIDRTPGYVAPAMKNLESGMSTLGEFIVPHLWPDAWVYVLGLIVLCILGVGAHWRRTRILAAIGLGYLVFVLLSLTFVDPGIPLDYRILLPVFPLAISVAAVAVAVALRTVEDRRHLAFAASVLLIVCFDYAAFRLNQVSAEIPYRVKAGFGFEGESWVKSPTLARVAEQPADVLVISGSPDAVRYLLGRTGVGIPNGASMLDDYQVRHLAARISERPAIFVDCPKLSRQPGTATARQMENWFNLALVAEEEDGKIYRVTLKEDALKTQ